MGKKQPPEEESKDKPSRTEQARQVAEEYANDLARDYREAVQAPQLTVPWRTHAPVDQRRLTCEHALLNRDMPHGTSLP
jgi:hypothetical protein